jgi:signal transduction histidine kinase/ActR/RegA family two-component response regulator
MNNSIVAERIRIILKFVGYTLATGFLGSVLIVLLALQGSTPNYWQIGAWFGLSTVNFLVRYLTFVRTRGLSPAERVSLSTRAWLHTFVSGCIWGASVLLFMPTLSPAYQAAFAIVLLGLNITSIPLMSDNRGISVLFLPAWLPMGYVLYLANGSPALPIAIIFMLGCVFLVAYIIQSTLDEFIAVRLQRDQALRELSHTNAMQMSLFLAASHDFRQPMQSISFYLMSVKRRLADRASDLTDVVEMIEERIENLHHLIDETIGFAKLSMGIEEPEIEAIAAEDLVEPLLANFRQSAEAKGLRFRVHCSDNCFFLANRQILNRILDNLISNALRNTRKGGIIVAFRKRRECCSIQVWDTGSGIAAYEQERVFDAFYQGKQHEREAQKGHGLGLMIVKRLSERIAADITLSSRIDRGTVFRLRLPLVAMPQVKQIRASAPSVDVRLDGCTVAIVDDNDKVRNSLKAFLSDNGANVINASSRDMLLEALREVAKVDLLLTDLHLEKEYGDDIVIEVSARYPSIKSIILTADASEATLDRLKKNGFTVLLKPVNPNALLEHIAAQLGLAVGENVRARSVRAG